jgi:D-3-phosphoglycerate dehydrogenase
MDELTFLIVGDGLCRSDVYEAHVDAAFRGTPFAVRFTQLTVDWPDAPLRMDGEVSEWVGSDDDIAAAAGGVDAIVTQVGPITTKVMTAADRLRVVACSRNVAVNVNVPEATRRAISVLCAPGRNAQAVAEFTIAILLSELKNVARAHASLVQGEWRTDLYRYESAGRELQGTVVGLVGYGQIGSRVARLLHPFDCEILVYDPYVDEGELRRAGLTRVDDLHELLIRADVVSLHARVTPQTRHMFGRREFGVMKPTAVLVNTARGPLVDYTALEDALLTGDIAAAALDTFSDEPLDSTSRLLSLPNVTLTPHIGGSSQQTAQNAAAMVAADLARYFLGREPIHCVNCRELALGRV